MKPELVVKVGVAVLVACVLGLMGSLIPWGAGLREPWHPGDYAAWVQAVGSVLAIVGTGIFVWYQVSEARKQGDRALRAERMWLRLEAVSALADVARFALLLVEDVNRAHTEAEPPDVLRRECARAVIELEQLIGVAKSIDFVAVPKLHRHFVARLYGALARVLTELHRGASGRAGLTDTEGVDYRLRLKTLQAEVARLNYALQDSSMWPNPLE